MEPPLTVQPRAVPLRVRELGPADRGLVEEGFDRLSEDTIRARFLGTVKPTPRLFAWVDQLDGHDRIAVGASHTESGVLLGLARYVRDELDPSRADVAITVIDGWQRRGVGTALISELARRAVGVGITLFGATVFAENRGARALMRKLGEPRFGRTENGVVSLEVPIAEASAREWPLAAAA